jgi:hypothetical protein
MKRDYCTQNAGHCETCALVSYGRDCRNNPVSPGGSTGAGDLAEWLLREYPSGRRSGRSYGAVRLGTQGSRLNR